ncbi:MAG: hypothetical protein JWN04_1089, partial [Myxococcaceae bacterium]|nr:hypothetical protein [Myxococcaceae bacterium]
ALTEVALDVDEMALRRLRQRTLERANTAIFHPALPRRPKRALALSLGLCVAVAAAIFLVARPTPEGKAPSTVLVEPQQNARWQRSLEHDVEHVELSSGTLLFRVARKPTDPRLVVHVPDGEIEDLGTTFSVSVQDGKTREITVREGRVLFHRRGASALHLVAGSSWTPPAPVAPALDLAPPPKAELPTLERKEAPDVMDQPKLLRRRARATDPLGEPVVVDDPAAAQSREDEAYLHVLALLREGRAAEARLAAFAYLKAFPRGFRRVEVARVTTAPAGNTSADD